MTRGARRLPWTRRGRIFDFFAGAADALGALDADSERWLDPAAHESDPTGGTALGRAGALGDQVAAAGGDGIRVAVTPAPAPESFEQLLGIEPAPWQRVYLDELHPTLDLRPRSSLEHVNRGGL